MATLRVRNLPDRLYEQLAARAERAGLSIGEEIAVLLTELFDQREATQRRALKALRSLDKFRKRYPQPPGAPDSVTLIREDRER